MLDAVLRDIKQMYLNLHSVLIKVVLMLICLLIYSKSLGLVINCSLCANKTENLTRWIYINL